jgi:ribosomal protein S18 acetylase RimI-like enzyme
VSGEADGAPGTPRPGFLVRAILPAEHETLGEITVAAYRDVGETQESYYAELRDVATRAARAAVLVAVEEGSGRVLGGLAYDPGTGPYAEGDFGDAATFRMLAVAPEERGRGVGRALVQAALVQARFDGRPAVGIFTRPFMAAAQRLYESLGFVRAAGSDWEFEPGEWLLAYRLDLPARPPSAG